jgi:CHAP domain
MPIRRAAVMGVVTLLSLIVPVRAETLATTSYPGVALQTDAADTGSASIRHVTRAASSEPPSSHVAFADGQTTWTLLQPSPPDELERTGVLQCVPFARYLSGIELHGDAWTWWDKAAGIYARGNYPEPGAVLSFPGTDRTPLGHVAVVTQILSARKILIDHANWPHAIRAPNAIREQGAISRDIQVEDVSSANDWTAVRVQFGMGGPMGSVYPANGFIYGWSETGARIAQPRFPLDYAPDAPGMRVFNAIHYLWALTPTERKKAFAAAAVVPTAASPARGRPMLVLGLPAGSALNVGALVQPLGVNRLDVGPGGKAGFAVGRYAVR